MVPGAAERVAEQPERCRFAVHITNLPAYRERFVQPGDGTVHLVQAQQGIGEIGEGISFPVLLPEFPEDRNGKFQMANGLGEPAQLPATPGPGCPE